MQDSPQHTFRGGCAMDDANHSTSALITINNVQIEHLTYHNEPVVTFEMIAKVHGIPVQNVHKAFRRHREHFIEGKHAYRLDYVEANQLVPGEKSHTNGLWVFTGKGYLLLIKTMNDAYAWEIQEYIAGVSLSAQRHMLFVIADIVAQNPKEHRSKPEKVLYIAHSPHMQMMKVGIANNIKTRFQCLETAHGQPLKLLYTLQTIHAKRFENLLHHYWDKYRTKGEWFLLPNYITSTSFVSRSKRYIARDLVPRPQENI
jgi:hypothetical protein